MTDIEMLVWTPEEAARYHERFLPGADPVTVADLRRHADTHGPYLVAETAWSLALKAPVPPVDAPKQGAPLRQRRRR